MQEATPFGKAPKYLICDIDTNYGPEFDRVTEACAIEVIHTPYQAPLANAIRERFIGSLRRECLDHIMILGRRQMVRVATEYSEYCNQTRPHTCTCAPVQM